MTFCVLTAAVSPNVAGPVRLMDPDERLRQYGLALAVWQNALERGAMTAVLIETTGFGAAALIESAELTGFAPIDFQPTPAQLESGKGAVEAACLDEFVRTLSVDEVVFKGTGRIAAHNAVRLLTPAESVRALAMRMSYVRPWVDTRFFAFRVGVWQDYLGGMSDEVHDADGVFLEHVMGRRALIALADGVSIEPLAARPSWTGASGSTDLRYGGLARRIAGVGASAIEVALRRSLRTKLL